MADRRYKRKTYVRSEEWEPVEDRLPGMKKSHFNSVKTMIESGFAHVVETKPLVRERLSNMEVFRHMVDNHLVHGDAAMCKPDGDNSGYGIPGSLYFGFTLLTDAVTFKLLKASSELK